MSNRDKQALVTYMGVNYAVRRRSDNTLRVTRFDADGQGETVGSDVYSAEQAQAAITGKTPGDFGALGSI